MKQLLLFDVVHTLQAAPRYFRRTEFHFVRVSWSQILDEDPADSVSFRVAFVVSFFTRTKLNGGSKGRLWVKCEKLSLRVTNPPVPDLRIAAEVRLKRIRVQRLIRCCINKSVGLAQCDVGGWLVF